MGKLKTDPVLPRMVVTGVSGLLGSNFAMKAARQFAITGFYRQHPIRLHGANCEAIDLKSESAVASRLDEIAPVVVAHFAAETNIDRCECQPEEAIAINVEATRYLSKWANANGARFLFMSTDSVFDGKTGGYTEDDEPNPLNRYANTKLEAESIVRSLVVDHLIVRASIYGWNAQPKSSLAEWIYGRLKTGHPISGFTDAIFSPLLANTLSDLMIVLLNRGACGTFHLASSDFISKYDFALAIAQIFDFPADLVKVGTLAGAGLRGRRPFNVSLNAAKVRNEFGLQLPTVRRDLLRFKRLDDEHYPMKLKNLCVLL